MRLPESKIWVRMAMLFLAIAFVSYMILIPTANALLSSFREKPSKIIQLQDKMNLSEQVRFRTIEGMTAFWFFAFGAAIGSFLNVVVYRMPLGESLVFKRSRCPVCGTQIHGRDNTPILGWLLLGGRCRACGTSISLRYPTIELIVGSLFLVLYFVELISGGKNLPIRRPNDYAGVVWIVFYTKWDLVTTYMYHCALLSMLLALALVDLDRKRLAKKSLLQFVLLMAVPACFFPHLLLVKTPITIFGNATAGWMQAISTVVVGTLVALSLGFGVFLIAKRFAGRDNAHFVTGLVLIGVSLGWQAVLVTFGMSLVLQLGWVMTPRWARGFEMPDDAIAGSFLHSPKAIAEKDMIVSESDAVELTIDSGSALAVDSGSNSHELPSNPPNQAVWDRRVPLSIFLFIAAIIHQVAWRWLFESILLYRT